MDVRKWNMWNAIVRIKKEKQIRLSRIDFVAIIAAVFECFMSTSVVSESDREGKL